MIKRNISKYLSNEFPIASSQLKEKLFEENLKEKKCECCKNIVWLDKPIPTELHHVDGNPKNNSLENLQILCPNCHTQTDNFSGKAKKQPNIILSDQEIIDAIPKFFNRKQVLNHFGLNGTGKGYLRISNLLHKHPELDFKAPTAKIKVKQDRCKIIWPAPENIQKLLWEKPTILIAKELGVSDKAVEKFCKKHNLSKPPRGYWMKNKSA